MAKKDEEKRGFATEQEARDELIRIVNTNYNTCKTKKPIRTYLSKITNLYHLTSKPIIFEYERK